MPSDPADHDRPVGRRRRWVAGLVALVVSLTAVTVGLGLVEKARVPVEKAPVPVEKAPVPVEKAPVPGQKARVPPTTGSRAHAIAAGTVLAALGRRLEAGSRTQVVALAARDDARARRRLSTLHHNVRSLHLSDLSLRYLGEDAAFGARHRTTLGNSGWVGDVRLRWRLPGFDRHVSSTRVRVTFRTDGGRTSFVSARAADGVAAPLWLLARVSVSRTATSLAVTAGRQPSGTFARLAARAVLDVRKVLGEWRGPLVVEVPGSQQSLGRVLGSPPATYGGLAAVTSTADGSADRGAPVHIFVNAEVFDRLGPRGAQIVISHEATHVATGAALSTMPTWLLEGFADYVAFAHAGLPVRVAAGEILGRVRRDGAPRRLPGRAEFAAHNPALGASYESAWLACRLLAREYGEHRLVAFYRASARASSTTRAFRAVLGTNEAAFTRRWRDDLRRLAG